MENYFNNTIPHKNIIRQLKKHNLYGDFILEIRKEQLIQKIFVHNIYQIVSYCLLWKYTPQGSIYWEDIKSILRIYRYEAFCD